MRRRVNTLAIGSTVRRRRRHSPAAATTALSGRRIGRLEQSLANAQNVTGLTFPEWEIPPSGDAVAHLTPRGQPWDWIYDEMERDPDLSGMLYRLYEAVLSLNRRIVAADATEGGRESSAMVRECLGKIRHWGEGLRHAVSHAGRGVAFLELNYTVHGGVFFPYEAWPRPMRFFGFMHDRRGEPELHVRRADAERGLIKPDPWKFLWPVRGLLHYPWGRGLMELLYWFWKARRYTWLDWQAYNERWLKPVPKIGYEAVHTSDREADDANNRKTESELLATAQNIYGDGAVVYDKKTTEVGTLEANMAGSAGFREYLDSTARSMARLVLAEINTLGLRPGTGAYASEHVSEGISHQKTCLVGHDLGAYLRDTLFTWLVQANLPGAPVPRMVIDMTTPAAREVLRKGVLDAIRVGFPVYEQEVKLAFGLSDQPEPGDVAFVARQQQDFGGSA